MSLKEVIRKVLLWRLFTVLAAVIAIPLLPVRTGFTYLYDFFTFPDLYNMWSNFDGILYADIAKYGYGYPHHTDKVYAFFPVYPWVIRFFAFTHDYVASGLFVSHLCLVLALFFLYKLLRLDFSSKISKRTITLMLIFPTAFFFGSLYTESLFLLLTVLSFYLIRKKHIFLSLVIAAIASATRVTGVLLWPALLIEFYLMNKKDLKQMIKPELIWFVLPPLGLISYMRFQLEKTGNAFFFVASQPNFNAGRAINRIILLHQVIFRYVKMMIFVDHMTATFFTAFLEFLTGLGFLVVLIYAFKKIRSSYLFYCVFSYLLPTLTGTFLSMPRFVLVLFPLFTVIAIAQDKLPPYISKIYYVANIILGILAIALFTRGYFVA